MFGLDNLKKIVLDGKSLKRFFYGNFLSTSEKGKITLLTILKG